MVSLPALACLFGARSDLVVRQLTSLQVSFGVTLAVLTNLAQFTCALPLRRAALCGQPCATLLRLAPFLLRLVPSHPLTGTFPKGS